MERSGYERADIDGLAASIAGFGLLLPISAFDGMAYQISPWLIELCELADITPPDAT